MNKTKRKIFEAAMELFAQKGYDGTSVEEITSVVGIAKGTLYYHFSSKEEILNFLIDEGIKLLKNSIEIKTSKYNNSTDKIKAVILIQIKIMFKYENLITMMIGEMWGTEDRNLRCRQCIYEYMDVVENIIEEGIKNGEFNNKNAKATTSIIFGLTSSGLIYKMKNNPNVGIQELFNEFSGCIIKSLKNNN